MTRRLPHISPIAGVTPELLDSTAMGREVRAHGANLELLPTDRTTNDVRPETILAALMQQAPGDAYVESIEDCEVLTEAIGYALVCLTAEDVFILNAIQHEGITYEQLADRLGVSRSQGWRLHARTLNRLRTLLLNHPPVRERLGMKPTWNAAAMTELIVIASYEEDWQASDPPYEVEAASGDVTHCIEKAVIALDGGREFDSVNLLACAAGYAVAHLRYKGQWSLLAMHTLLCSKQNDYGHGNILKFGMTGVVVRASDKAERLKNLVTHHAGVKPSNETVKDTFDDVIGYAVIARMLKAETFELELEATNEESAA